MQVVDLEPNEAWEPEMQWGDPAMGPPPDYDLTDIYEPWDEPEAWAEYYADGPPGGIWWKQDLPDLLPGWEFDLPHHDGLPHVTFVVKYLPRNRQDPYTHEELR